MDLTNRILIIGGALLWIFVVIVVILLAWGAPDESIERIADLAGYLEDHNDTPAKLILTLGGLILVLLAAIVVIVEVAPPETGTLKIANVGTGEARIPTDEVAHLLEQELRQLPQLTQVQASVQARGDKAEVSLDLHVGADADLTATTEEACRRAGELISQRIGVSLARPPRAQLHYKELRVARKPAPTGSPSGSTASPFAPGSGASAPSEVATPSSPTPSTYEASQTTQEDRPAGP